MALKRAKINFNWDDNSEVYNTLERTKLHITYFSSVVEDSLNLNIPSYILSKQGEKYYSKHIEEGKGVYYVDNIDDAILIFKDIIN